MFLPQSATHRTQFPPPVVFSWTEVGRNRLVRIQTHFSMANLLPHVAFSNECGSKVNADQSSSRSIILRENFPLAFTSQSQVLHSWRQRRKSLFLTIIVIHHNIVQFYIVYVYIVHQTLISKEQENSRCSLTQWNDRSVNWDWNMSLSNRPESLYIS